MTIADIIRRGRGTAGAWRVDRHGATATLVHYGTPMVTWRADDPADPSVLDIGTGWGSVSDQNGVNTACRVLGLPYRMDRDARGGGPRITELTRHPCGCVTDPSVHQCTCNRALVAS
jgi:hypothetical protein